ncbi:MAG: BACON domain-containing protein, partial [Terriglobia bacterium]
MQEDQVSYVDLSPPYTLKPFPTTVPSGTVVLSNSYIYVFPSTQGGPVYISVPDGSEGTANAIQASSARLDPPLNAIYAVRNDVSSPSLVEVGVPYGFPTSFLNGPSSVYYRTCGNLWLSPDGNSLYTGCGTVFNTSDMSYAAGLGGLGEVQSLSISTTNQVAAIPLSSDGPDTEVWLYSSTDFSTHRRFVLPDGGHGKWVFFNQDGSEIYVIAEVGSSYELDTIDPSDTCTTASFTSGTAVNVAASGALEDASISSDTGCTFQATSNASWISLVSGNYGSGDITLRYVVRPNTGSQSRQGAITLGDPDNVLTITQDPPS